MPGQMKRFKNIFSRTQQRIQANLGVIDGNLVGKVKKVRNKDLEVFDAYYESIQYDKLSAWDSSLAQDGSFVPVRQRQPRLVFNFAKVFVDRLAAKLVGADVFPQMTIEDSPDDNEFLKAVIKASEIKSQLLEPVRYMCLSGSCLVRFFFEEGSLLTSYYHSKYCYPKFKPDRTMESVMLKYTYTDPDDLNPNGDPKEKWYRLDLTENSDILYDNPEFEANVEPTFTAVSTNTHNLGFVQAEWFRTTYNRHTPDGVSLIKDCLDFIDELNYNLSQSSQAISYNQEPQLGVSGMDLEEVDTLIKTSAKAWNLGREGKAAFIETGLQGVQAAGDFRDKIRLGLQDVSRILLMDPEKMVSHAQSGRALEVLHGPFLELINELRPVVEKGLVNLITKISMAYLTMAQQGIETDLTMPDGYFPSSLDITTYWPHVFPLTFQDLTQKAQVASSVTAANLFSRETMTRWLAKDFGVENVEEELAKIQTQMPLDPFGSSMYGGGDTGGGPDEPQQGAA